MRTSSNMQKIDVGSLNLSDEELALVQRAADLLDVTIEELIYKIAIEEAKRVIDADRNSQSN